MIEEIEEGLEEVAKRHPVRALRREAKRGADATNRYVQHNPWKALGVAAVCGCILGLLVGWTRREP